MSQNKDLIANSDTFVLRCDVWGRYSENYLADATTDCHKSALFDQKATNRKPAGQKCDFMRQESLLGLYAFELAFFTTAVVKKICLEANRPGFFVIYQELPYFLGLWKNHSEFFTIPVVKEIC